MRCIDYPSYVDKVLGGWIGGQIGAVLGAPARGYKRFNLVEPQLARATAPFPHIDLDLQLVWLDLAKQKGPFLREIDLAEQWKKHVRLGQAEYGIAGRNLALGVYPPQSGEHNNDYWHNGMGAAGRAEIWGLLNPGMPAQAAYFAGLDASVDHDGLAVDAARFFAAVTAEAFFENDVFKIIENVSHIFHHQSEFTDLLDDTIALYEENSWEMALHKMKSRCGNADTTWATMNVGLVLLALLYHEPVSENLPLTAYAGHDSIANTGIVGAIYGVLSGISGIPDEWRKLVNDPVLIHSGIVGLETPKSLTELANDTCRAGLTFIDFFKNIQISGKELKPFALQNSAFAMNTLCIDYEPGLLMDEQRLDIEYENLTAQQQSVKIHLFSDEIEFTEPEIEFNIEGIEFKTIKNGFALKPEVYDALISPVETNKQTVFYYHIEVSINGRKQAVLTRGLPFYGAWFMFGPFLLEDNSCEPPNPAGAQAAESLPTWHYQNHDKFDRGRQYITVEQARRIAEDQNFEDYPFQIEPFNPHGFYINIGGFFAGRGERTVYLYTKIFSREKKKIWLVMGCSVLLQVWWNGEKILDQQEIRRTWPLDITIAVELQIGVNDILLRIDTPIDSVDLFFGIKKHTGESPFLSEWDIELVPFV